MKGLSFEKPLRELYEKIDQLKELSEGKDIDISEEIKKIEQRASLLKKDIYSNLGPHQIIQISRHPNRPDSLSLAKLIFDEFIELHGDRQFRDDPSIVGGLAKLGTQSVMIIGHQKGHDTKGNIYRNFGMPHPEGYRKALRLMKMAEKFNMPIVTFIDTPGAFPGIEAEERGQAEAIARNLFEMVDLKVPIVSIVIGEGGSGGALGIGVANRVYLLKYAVYSVISPEGCASILFRDASKAELASKSLNLTSSDIVSLGVADGVIEEPTEGAHTDWNQTAANMKSRIESDLAELGKMKTAALVKQRHQKFRDLGQFSE